MRKFGSVHAAIIWQASSAISRRPLRSLLTAVGVALGIAVFVASMGLAATLNSEVNATFDSFRATRLTVQDTREFQDDQLFDSNTIDELLSNLTGVTSGGMMVSLGEADATANLASKTVSAEVIAATPGALEAALISISGGRIYDEALIDGSDIPVVILGHTTAERLGGTGIVPGSVISINGASALVVGILDSFGSEPQLGSAIITAPARLDHLGFELPHDVTALVRTEIGAASSVATMLPLVLRPQDPSAVGILLPPEPQTLRTGVQGSLDSLALGVAALSLVIGGVGIMNAMVMSVSQRTGEIGLRRALGARPVLIVEHILLEGVIIGFLGALVGLVVGLAALIVISLYNDWQPVLASWVWVVPPAAGAIIGALAGVYPAIHAARLSPAEALRR